MDYWPDIIFELKYIKSKINKTLLNKIVNYIYKKQDCILAQSESYLKKISEAEIYNPKQKLIYFPSWPEDIKQKKNSYIDKIFKKNSKDVKIVFTGNVGEAQGFEKVIELCKKFENLKFKIFVIGTGRWIDKIQELIIKKKINKIKFFGHKPVNQIYPFLKMLIFYWLH